MSTAGRAVLLGFVMLVAVATATIAQKKEKGKMEMPQDRVMAVSKYGYQETVSKIKKAIEYQDLMVLRELDHQEMLKMVGVEAMPMTTILFFHPRLGKEVFTKNKMAGIEPPLKVVIMEKEKGVVEIAYKKPSLVFGTYKGLEELEKQCEDIYGKILSACGTTPMKM